MQWDAQRYVSEAGFVPAMARDLIDVLAPRAGERILDLGCGDGALTALLAAAGARVLGIDSSPEQIGIAVGRGLDALVMDAGKLPFEAQFEAVFSNAALHWMLDADVVARGIFRSLKPGGRLVAEMGGAGNVASIVAALEAALRRRDINPAPLNPWYFPTPAQHAGLLEGAGFSVRQLQYFKRPTPFARDVGDWLSLMAVPFLGVLPAGMARKQLVDEVRETLQPTLLDPDGVWQLDYVRLRFVAEKPA